MKEHPSQYYLDFTYSSYGEPTITKSSIRVPVREFWVEKGFPEYHQDTYYPAGFVIFEEVASSVRKIYEYTSPERKEYKPVQIIEDGPFAEVKETGFLCNISGIFYISNAWIEWEIMAARILIESEEGNK